MKTLAAFRNNAPKTKGWVLLILSCFQMMMAISRLRADTPPALLFTFDSSSVPSGFRSPVGFAETLEGMCVDGARNIYVSDTAGFRYIKFSPSGSYLAQWEGLYPSSAGSFIRPSGIATDDIGNVYLLDPARQWVQKFTGGGSLLSVWNISFSPYGIAIDASNNVYVSERVLGYITKWTGTGTSLGQWGTNGSLPGQFATPLGVATDPAGNVYVVDSGNIRIQKFAGDGTFILQWGTNGTGPGKFGNPCFIAIDPSTNVYVSDSVNNVIQKFDGQGHFLAQWGGTGTNVGQFNNLTAIAVDRTGSFIYAADSGNKRIQVFAYPVGPPFVWNHPKNQTVPAGSTVIVRADADGAMPLTYQWTCNGTNVPGGISNALILSNVTLADSGIYALAVTNSAGTTNSSNGVLTVLPIVMTTLPVTGISAAAATLNATAALGPNDSTAWFEWGPNTNYGNVAGITNLPGSGTTIPVSVLLTNLNGDLIYHCRVVGSNSVGIVFGNDIQFQVGVPVVAVTLAPTDISLGGATFTGTINPGGRHTIAYFLWGPTVNYGNTTSASDLGNGIVPVDLTANISGLAAAATYHYCAVGSNSLGLILGPDITFTTGRPPITYHLERVSPVPGGPTNPPLNQPTYITQAPGDPGNIIYYTTRNTSAISGFSANNSMGKVWRYDLNTRTATMVLDLSVRRVIGDDGIECIAFHPDFNISGTLGYGKMYVSSAEASGTTTNRVEEYFLKPENIAAGAVYVRTILQYLGNGANGHTVDWIGFDPTANGEAHNYLFISTGDGANGAGYNNAVFPGRASQNPADVRGKILRVDLTSDDYPDDPLKNYAVPPSNPIPVYNAAHPGSPIMGRGTNGPTPAVGEVFVTGNRNSYRMSFDRLTGDMYWGDVGEVTWEEVNFLKAGSNTGLTPPPDYGWPLFEAAHTISFGGAPQSTTNIFTGAPCFKPVREWQHTSGGNASIGGYVYRGPIPELQGKYFYADYVAGRLWMLDFDRNASPTSFNGTNGSLTDITALWNSLIIDTASTNPPYVGDNIISTLAGLDHIVSFGEDAAGNLYIVDLGFGAGFDGQYTANAGEIFKVVPTLPPTLNWTRSGSNIQFSWSPRLFKLQAQTNAPGVGLTTNWFDYPGGTNTPLSVPVNPAAGSVFYRLVTRP